MKKPVEDLAKWAAWWSGDPDILSAVYGGGHTSAEQSFAQRGGLLGAINRFFWGQPPRPGEQRAKLHIPLPAEIAQVSADLLFGQPPQITVDDAATQERINVLMGEALHTQMHEAAESASALGHVYMRVGWDLDIDPDRPLFHVVDADAAFPTYRYGRLIAVTFVREFPREHGREILRHLEHHEKGFVEHGLYLGSHDNLGVRVPLGEHPETADLVESVTDLGSGSEGVETGLDRLDVVAVANARSRTWRHLPSARDLGRADISGVEQELDALDDVWSSWMRDVRHGRSRIHVPQHYLEFQGLGKGARVDLDREVYVGLNALTDSDRMELTATQFRIRWQEHRETALSLIERIVSGAGYSPQTFGLQGDAALTATESWARQVRTQNTRNGKIRRWRQALVELTQLMVEVDRVHFGGNGNPDLVPDVEFPDTVSESLLATAQTASLLSAAEVASTETLVRLLHPDWGEEQVRAEVQLILGEKNSRPAEITTGSGDGDPSGPVRSRLGVPGGTPRRQGGGRTPSR